MSTPISDTFAQLKSAGRLAFMPFVTAGDPDMAATQKLLTELSTRGVDLIEVGFPYSDPIADGPVIQASYTRALDAGVTVAGILDMARRVAPELNAPLVGMLSYAIPYRMGLETFVGRIGDAGFDGLIVPDLPIEESSELASLTAAAGVSLIQLITPTTPRDRAVAIARTAQGFIYYVSVTGITGERESLPEEIAGNLKWLRGQTDLPICVGFGINRAEQVRQLAPMVDGVIVGSAIVRRIAAAEGRSSADVARDVGAYVDELCAPLAE